MSFDPTAPAFTAGYAFVLPHEKGTVDDPADHGGRTKDGITQATYDAWRMHRGLGTHDVFVMPDAERDAIYLARWADFRCSEIATSSVAAAICYFDMTVNHRPKAAGRMFQQVSRVPPENWDGVVGKVSLSMFRIRLKDVGPSTFVADLLARRTDFYKTIVHRDPSQQKFAHGWRNRVWDLCDYVSSPRTTWELS